MLRKLPGKLQETNLSQPFFPSNKGRYACKLGDRFPKGILLTTHDHALLTKNSCALAPEYKGTLRHLEERAQRAHYRTCYAWHARTCADRRPRRVFPDTGRKFSVHAKTDIWYNTFPSPH